MKAGFHKYHGTGNDFIIIDNRTLRWSPGQLQVAALCNRHTGIGADGLMLLSELPGYDFTMTYFNSDGLESTMCGNGGRCITAFAMSLGLTGSKVLFRATDGDHLAEVLWQKGSESFVRLRMKDTTIGNEYEDGVSIDTGSPHFVKFVEHVDETDVVTEGRALRHDARFSPGGSNINFVGINDNYLTVRTYERGVESETLSCGTGVTAAALVYAMRQPETAGEVRLLTRGGSLLVQYVRKGSEFSDIWLEGPAMHVFSGEVLIP